MPKASILLLLLALFGLPSKAQNAPQSQADMLPTVTTQGDTNPEVVSDINAQLIWLLAASPATKDSELETAARDEYQRIAFGGLGAADQSQLGALLRDFRSRHDALAAEYNALVPTIKRDDVWMEYRNFRVKMNDLVAETVRTLNDQFPDGATRFRNTVQVIKNTVALSAYRSSADPNYATNPRTAATGFTYIQGALTASSNPSQGTNAAPNYTTAVIVGMVPGCPGKVVPNIAIGGANGAVDGPRTHPWEYVNFQLTKQVSGPQSGYVIAVGCEVPNAR